MTATNVNVAGTVKFFDQSKGFGIVTTKAADVFIHVSKCAGKQVELVVDAEVRIDYITTYKDGEYKHSTTALLAVKAPPAPVDVLDTVKFYNPAKNFGFIFCGGAGFSKDEAILRGHVAKRAGIIPGKGMPVRAMVIQKPEGPEVVSFEWGPEVEAAYAAKLGELHAEDGAAVELGTADSVDELMATHAAETQHALGQTPATEEVVEIVAEATAKSKKGPRRQSKGVTPIKGGIPKASDYGIAPEDQPGTIAAAVAACALNGSGGTMAEAFASAK